MANYNGTGLIVKKVGMTRMTNKDGQMIAVTLLQAQEQKVTKILSVKEDGYSGYQVGYFQKSKKNLTKADLGRLGKAKVEESYSRFCEFRTLQDVQDVELGSALSIASFSDIKAIDITGITKGRGYQGAVKRWGNTIGRMTHGSRFHRRPGSLGSNSTPGRVQKGKPQPGQMGNIVKTVQNLDVLAVDLEQNVIAVKGSVPGTRNGFLQIRPTNKK